MVKEELQDLIVSNSFSTESIELMNRLAYEIPNLVCQPQVYDPDKDLVEQLSKAIDNRLRQLRRQDRVTFDPVDEVAAEQEVEGGAGGLEEAKVPETSSNQQQLGMGNKSGKE